MVTFLKLLLKIFAVLIGLALLSGLGFYLYDQYQKSKELDYGSSNGWSWQSYPWQIDSEGDRLRAVDLDHKYELIVSVKSDEASDKLVLGWYLYFEQACEANTEIVGDAGTNRLYCLPSGDLLATGYSENLDGSYSYSFRFNLSGFVASETVAETTLRPLIRAAALTTAQPVDTE